MAATTSRSPLKHPVYPQIKCSNPSPFITVHLLKRRRNVNRFHSRINCSTDGEINQKNQAIELQNRIQGDPYEFDSKSPPASLPRPLTSALVSNSASEASPLRVAYQGVPGAYSESAAEKAYPNCEAVPCEQFDTAFQVVFAPFNDGYGWKIS